MNHVAFIVGLCGPSPSDYDGLMWKNKATKPGEPDYNITDYWGKPLAAAGHDLLVLRWNQANQNDATKEAENIAAMKIAIAAKWGNDPVKIVGHSLGGWAATLLAADLGMPCWGLDPVDPRHTDKPNLLGINLAPNIPFAKAWYRPPTMTAVPPKGIHDPIYSTCFNGPQAVNVLYQNNDHGWPVWQHPIISEVASYSFPIVSPAPSPAPVVSVMTPEQMTAAITDLQAWRKSVEAKQ